MRIGGHSQYAPFCNLSLVHLSVPTTDKSLPQSLYSLYRKNFMEKQPDSLFKNRNFMLLWSGQLVSHIGTAITNIALPLPVFEITTATYTVSVVPDAIRGRILSLTRLVVLGAYSLGFFVTGILLQFVGSTRTIVIFSCLLFFLALIVIFNKSLRQI